MQAQTCPPEPDCFQDVFQPGQSFTVSVSDNQGGFCNVTIEWCWRWACGTTFDIAITKIILDLNNCPGYQTVNIEDIKIAAMKKIAATGSMNTGFRLAPCDEEQPTIYWRLGIGSCLESKNIVDSDMKEIVSCGDAFCWQSYTMCLEGYDLLGQPIVRVEDIGSPTNTGNSCASELGTVLASSYAEQWSLLLTTTDVCIYFCD